MCIRDRKKHELVSTSVVLTCGLTFLMAAGYLVAADWVTPELGFVNDSLWSVAAFVVFAVAAMLFAISESIFIAERRAPYVLWKNLLNSAVKLSLPFFFTFGAFAIFSSWGVSLLVSAIFVLFVLGARLALRIDWKMVRGQFSFGMANYFANLILMLPFFGLPVFITHVLTPEDTAFFYIPWMMSVALFLIPQNVGKVLLSEGSYDSKTTLLRKSFLFNYAIIIPAIVILIVFGRYILSFFGASYVTNSWPVLPLLLLSSLLFSVPAIMSMYYNIENKTKNIIIINLVLAIGTFGFGTLLLSQGLFGIALGWTLANMLAILLLPFLGK